MILLVSMGFFGVFFRLPVFYPIQLSYFVA
jgi:hypothetical protein